MGRFAAYSGKEVTWDYITQSQVDLMPDEGGITMDTPITSPGMQMPGQYELV
jgi:hypothetical protein